MRVYLNNNDGKYIDEFKFSRNFTSKIKEFLKHYQDRDNGKEVTEYPLFFAGGEWRIPKDKVNEMYRQIVLAYSRTINGDDNF